MAETKDTAVRPQRTDDVVGVIDATTQVDILDYFAAAALAGGLLEFFRSGDTWKDYDDFAVSMFNVADAMVRRRAQVRAQSRPDAAADLLALVHQYRDDMRHGVSELGSRGRRLEQIEAVLARVEGR